MNLGQQALAANNRGRTRELLERNRPKAGQLDLRGWEWRYLWRQCRSEASFSLPRHSDSILSAAFLQDGKRDVVRNTWGATEVWGLTSRTKTADLGGYGSGRVFAVSRKGELVAFGATNAFEPPVIKLWSSQPHSVLIPIPTM